jgi:hypothetical protein
MNDIRHHVDKGDMPRRFFEAAFWMVLITVLWTLDTLTKLRLRERTGVGLDDFRLIAEQATSAAGVLVMVGFVAWWMNHFPIRRGALLSTAVGHLVGSALFSLGHYAIQITLREIVYPLFDREYGSPVSLLSNLIFEYQKDVKVYVGVVAIIAMYRLFLGGENRLQVRPRAAQKILVQTGSGEAMLSYDQIDYLEAARNYVVVHAGDREYLVRTTMSKLIDRLANDEFVRSHRSFAVNLAKVDEVRSQDSGYLIRLTGGQEIPLSRSYRDEFRQRMRQ